MMAVIMHACMSCELSDWGKPAPPGTEEENDYLLTEKVVSEQGEQLDQLHEC